jgi:uncharacterized protein YutE (UPF0331/DUF86 family)
MSPGKVSERIATARIAWVREMIARLRALPLGDYDAFAADPRNVASAESYLRRALEALLDLGRHILAKGFGVAATEYREIAARLLEAGVVNKEQSTTLARMAGYRNRLVHFYHEVGDHELYEICATQLADVDAVTHAIAGWIAQHPERIDRSA